MLNVGAIGIGNAGNQVVALAKEQLDIPVIAVNSTEKDLETLPSSVPKKLIIDKEGKTQQGSGKDRSLAKKYLKDSVVNFLSSEDVVEFMATLDELFVISSTGGGTGSGTAPLLASLMAQKFPDVHVILIGITPVNDDGYSSQVNSLEYLNEVYNAMDRPTYMLYDNDKLAGLPTYQVLERVNEEIVRDIDVLRCTFNYTTKYDSIDDRDMVRLLSFPGRVMVARLEDFKEKDCDTTTIEDMLINCIKTNCHVENQRDKKVMATGIITNLSQTLTEEFDNNIMHVREFIGDPVHAFNHIYVNEDRSQANNVFLIMSGLTAVNDKVYKISDRITEIDEKQKIMEESAALNDVDMNRLSSKIADEQKEDQDSVDVASVFARFGA